MRRNAQTRRLSVVQSHLNEIMLQVLKSIFKRSTCSGKPAGFTLTELLVAIAMAGLIITPLLGFVVGLLNSDRREQAKGRTEQELQAALDFIARDLEQALFIYDADALTTNQSDTAASSGIQDQIPPTAGVTGCNSSECTPILVFWKREFVQNAVPLNTTISCPPASTDPDNCDDAHVLSLVAYYLIEDDDANINNTPWSSAARIARFKIRDGVLDPNQDYEDYVDHPDNRFNPDAGFKAFDLNTLNGNSIKEKMSRWQNAGAYPQRPGAQVLIDYVNGNNDGLEIDVNCSATIADSVLIPQGSAANKTNRGFYACVNSDRTLARVFIRGNIRARFGDDTAFTKEDAPNFPTTSVQVQGRGVLGGG